MRALNSVNTLQGQRFHFMLRKKDEISYFGDGNLADNSVETFEGIVLELILHNGN